MIKNVRLKVVGVTFTNEDGTSRQSIIKELKQSDTITLRREPTNKFDTNAIAVFTESVNIFFLEIKIFIYSPLLISFHLLLLFC